MIAMTKSSKTFAALAALALPVTAGAQSQELEPQAGVQSGGETMTVVGTMPSDLTGMPEGPEFEGVISARDGDKVQVTSADGTRTVVAISPSTEIRSSGGFLGLDKDQLAASDLLNGLPVEVKTVEWANRGLIATKVALKSKHLETARMIHTGTDQRFTANEAATEALRGRVANIDQYNVKGTTNVYFDTARYNLSQQARAELCQAAEQAKATDNALLLVVGYTDSTGDYEYNQELSEKRAARVTNFLQQECDWAPYRMMTPTGMAEADPAADNTTEQGKAQNRRVAVNILVSKSVDGMSAGL
ncbi:OmpA family protein [Qipengyuania flava]|uniref:OmpA family protein n=1 Tax=Qipengyuania flava TaxID=192812 RepID=A0A5P6NI29_9SPHN|nr:OmpA family protein [Qipengyuania flava]MEC7161806.1 OmpA family protein [Pseudomonadota bacterium]MEC7422283.1 OmpA family protein [Pseudomonadota bacterium]MEC9109542.1 OmpA family protein [Pseudomonadota bacterium]QFI64833.1 OmpA family protein [Qipengyuania flava]